MPVSESLIDIGISIRGSVAVVISFLDDSKSSINHPIQTHIYSALLLDTIIPLKSESQILFT